MADNAITILFFASLRESLGTVSLRRELSDSGAGQTLQQLRQALIDENGPDWQILAGDDVQLAVNQRMTGQDHVLNPGDEVAFFPPVTGG